MTMVHKVHKDGGVMVPRPLLKQAGLKPGIGVIIQVSDSSLIIERARRSRSTTRLNTLKPLRGSLKHIDWDAIHLELQDRWSAWRDRRSA